MKDFIVYLKEEHIIETFISQKKVEKLDRDLLIKIIQNVEKSYNLIQNSPESKIGNLDLFGNSYETIINHDERKSLGEFYTPFSIVDYILNEIGYNNKNEIANKNLIDLSCGSGSFLIQAIHQLIEYHKIFYNKKETADFSLSEAKSIIQRVKDNIFGIDINPIACLLCQINIHFVLFKLFKIIRKQVPNYHLPKFNVNNIDALSYNKKRSFNFVVGNPPYLFIRDIPKEQKKLIETSNFHSKVGQYDYYQIFIELGIRLLKEHGFLGYIIPDSLLALSNRSASRRYIYNSTKIKQIYHTGPKFVEINVSNIILILQKESIRKSRESNIIQIQVGQKKHKMVQKLIQNWDYKFLINLNSKDIIILEHLINNFPNLNDLTTSKDFKIILSRGVELGKEGKVIFCVKCQKYLPLPKKDLICKLCNSYLDENLTESIIFENLSTRDRNSLKTFIYSINRYKIKELKYIDIEKQGINYKDLPIYENRIIIRQLSENNRICATYDENVSLTSQSFYNLKILKSAIPEFNHLYLLGIINSTLLSYYFIKSFGSYKKLFPRILIGKIRDFPIKIPKNDQEVQLARKISEYVADLLNSGEKNNNLILNVQREIDLLVFELYQIQTADQEHIFDFMNDLN